MHVSSAANGLEENTGFVFGLDVRTKILICLSMSVAIIFLKSTPALGFLSLISLAYTLNMGRYQVVAVCYIALCLMWLIAIGVMRLMHMASPMIPVTEPVKMLIPFLRITVMLNTVLALALSSRVQTLLNALKSFRLPIWLYIPSAVMIRFIPSFIKDVNQIHEAMRIRGYSPNPFFILAHPRLSVRLLVAPIIFRALRSADDLGVAAELKGVGTSMTGAQKLESYTPLKFKTRDALALAATLAALIVSGVIQAIYGIDATGMF